MMACKPGRLVTELVLLSWKLYLKPREHTESRPRGSVSVS